jgi:hypothetical protein
MQDNNAGKAAARMVCGLIDSGHRRLAYPPAAMTAIRID